MEIKQILLYSHSVVFQKEIIREADAAYDHSFYGVSAEMQESSHLEETKLSTVAV